MFRPKKLLVIGNLTEVPSGPGVYIIYKHGTPNSATCDAKPIRQTGRSNREESSPQPTTWLSTSRVLGLWCFANS